MKLISLILSTAFLLSACASTAPPKARAKNCQFKKVSFKTDFEGARLNGCKQRADGGFELFIEPEDNPINPSAWYAFDVVGAKGQTLNIELVYSEPGKHRYTPKVLRGGAWTNLLSVDDDLKKPRADFSLHPGSNTLRIAAQPIIDTKTHNDWIDKMAQLPFVTASRIGSSLQNRPIRKLEEVNGQKPFVVIVGRQHPPETTGAQALMAFVETAWGDSPLAKNFRANFNLLVIPMINPDGVANGNWRHNMNGVDLNRDWGPFTQRETQAVQQELQRFKSGRDDIVFFVDFHSTWRNLLYTQPDDEPTEPALFTRAWIKNVKGRLPRSVYAFTREAAPTSERPVSKNYMYKTYGIPAITYEVGDNTTAQNIETSSTIFAEEMMTLLLEKKTPGS